MSSGPFLFAPGCPARREKSLTTMPNQHLQSRDGEASSSNFKSQVQEILEVLLSAQGAEVPLKHIMNCAAQYSRCIHDLRRKGFKIINRTEMRNGVKHSWYRLQSSPAEPIPGTRKKTVVAESASSSPSEPTRTPRSPAPAQTLSLFPEMSAPAAPPQRSVWRDPELDGVKNGGVKHG